MSRNIISKIGRILLDWVFTFSSSENWLLEKEGKKRGEVVF
jgi:hypothetical protein